jgi:hypothetical protein
VEASEPASAGGAGDSMSSAGSFRFRFRIICLDTVAACNSAIASLVVEGSAWGRFR